GLVIGRLVNVRHTLVAGDLEEPLGRHQRVLFVLDRARAADEDDRVAAAHGDTVDPDFARRHRRARQSRPPRTKPATSGCGSRGRERNSGWNWPATKNG